MAMAELVIMPRRARGQSWPERPITLVIMYDAGGGTHTNMRCSGDEMATARGW
jgi:tripartite-type tricarboxylate transporter receptor subunit TctC